MTTGDSRIRRPGAPVLALLAAALVVGCAYREHEDPPAVATEARTPVPALESNPNVERALPVAWDRRAVAHTVVDGDTVRLLEGETVRYLGVDTPERGEPFYAEAAARNAELVLGHEVLLEREHTDRDRYGRLLRHAWILRDDGTPTSVGEILVREGLARAAPYRPDVGRERALRAAEDEARAAGVGLWKDLPAESEYIAGKHQFHRPTCKNVATLPHPVRYATRAAASDAGLRAARCCDP